MSSKRLKFVNRRKVLDLTQEQVAQAVGVSPRTVQRWEAGERFPEISLVQVWRLCEVLQCSVEDLARDFYPDEFSHDKRETA